MVAACRSQVVGIATAGTNFNFSTDEPHLEPRGLLEIGFTAVDGVVLEDGVALEDGVLAIFPVAPFAVFAEAAAAGFLSPS